MRRKQQERKARSEIDARQDFWQREAGGAFPDETCLGAIFVRRKLQHGPTVEERLREDATGS